MNIFSSTTLDQILDGMEDHVTADAIRTRVATLREDARFEAETEVESVEELAAEVSSLEQDVEDLREKLAKIARLATS